MDRKKATRIKIIIVSILILIGAILGYKNGVFCYEYNYFALIPNTGDGTISIVDTKKHEVMKKIDVGDTISDNIAVSKNGRFIYSDNVQKGNVYVIDTTTGKTVKEIKTGFNIHEIDITPDGRYIYVAGEGLKDGKTYGNVSTIDTRTNEVTGNITFDRESLSHVDFSKYGDYAYISNVMPNEVAIVNLKTKEIVKRVPVGSIPDDIEPSLDGKRLYVANVGDGTLSIIDLVNFKTLKVVKAGEGTYGVAVSPDDKFVWTANMTSNDVTVIDVSTGKVVKKIKIGGTPKHLSVIPGTDIMYVSNKDSGNIAVIDMRKYEVIKRIQVGKEPHEIALANFNE